MNAAPDNALEALLRHPALWRAGRRPARADAIPTGFAALDAALPGGGWPRAALAEILVEHPGAGEIALLAPALARLGAAGRWCAWIDPPCVPYAPALAARGIALERTLFVAAGAGRLWAAEEALRSGACAAVLVWAGAAGERGAAPRALRRLQVAAREGGALGVVLGPPARARVPSPAVLRLALAPAPEGAMRLRVLKCRGAAGGAELRLAAQDAA